MINLTTKRSSYPLLQTTINCNKACEQEMVTISATCQIIVMMMKMAKIHNAHFACYHNTNYAPQLTNI